MLLVSVEGLPGACRDAVTKAVQARLGAAALPAGCRRSSNPLVDSASFLLHQAKALRHVTAPVVVSHASWLDRAPPTAAEGTGGGGGGGEGWARALHAELAGVLRRRLGLPATGVHHMVYLRSGAHEAFESVIESGAEGRDISLHTLHVMQSRLDACAAGARPADSLFPVVLHTVPCPAFASDSSGAVDRAADAVLAGLPPAA